MICKNNLINSLFITLILITSTIFQPAYSATNNSTKQEFDILKPGKAVKKTYTFKKGDNYYKIAKKLNMNYWSLMQLNNAKSPYAKTGHTILLSKSFEPGNKYDGIIINIPEQRLYFFYKDKLSKVYKVSVGKNGKQWKTPTGDFKILYKNKAPTWHVPVSIQKEMKAEGKKVKKEVKPGPDNPLGNWFLGLDDKGLGIHSTNAPASIGYSITHGCIRMNSKSAVQLFYLVKENTPVKIIYQPIKLDFDGKNKAYLEVYKNIYGNKLKTVQIVKTLLKKYNVKESDIDFNKVERVAVAKAGVPVLISKK
jgi:L,D-transpeptidase ErfK/SrfK